LRCVLALLALLELVLSFLVKSAEERARGRTRILGGVENDLDDEVEVDEVVVDERPLEFELEAGLLLFPEVKREEGKARGGVESVRNDNLARRSEASRSRGFRIGVGVGLFSPFPFPPR
jgi:hypothetical protein